MTDVKQQQQQQHRKRHRTDDESPPLLVEEEPIISDVNKCYITYLQVWSGGDTNAGQYGIDHDEDLFPPMEFLAYEHLKHREDVPLTIPPVKYHNPQLETVVAPLHTFMRKYTKKHRDWAWTVICYPLKDVIVSDAKLADCIYAMMMKLYGDPEYDDDEEERGYLIRLTDTKLAAMKEEYNEWVKKCDATFQKWVNQDD